jgi:hypothetical protein
VCVAVFGALVFVFVCVCLFCLCFFYFLVFVFVLKGKDPAVSFIGSVRWTSLMMIV